MRIPLLLYGLALAVRVVLIWHFPDPAYPDSFYYVDVARALAAGRRIQRRLRLDLPRGRRRRSPPTRPSRSRPTRTGCPSRRSSRCRSSGCSAPRAWASALPFALIGAVAAPLTWAIARDAGARGIVAEGAGILVAIPVLSRGLHGPAGQLLALPAAGDRGALDGRPRPQGLGPRRSPWPGCWPASRRCPATTACSSWPRSGWPSSGIAGAPGARSGSARRPSRGRGRRLRRACSCSSWRRGGRASWRSSARSRRPRPRARCCSSATSTSGTASRPRPRLEHLLGMGLGPLVALAGRWADRRDDDLRDARRRVRARAVHGRRRLGAPAVARLRAVLPLRRAAVRVLGARLRRPRPGRHVHPLRGRAGAARLHPGPGGDRRRGRLGRRASAARGTRQAATRTFVGRGRRLRGRRGRRRRARSSTRCGRTAGPTFQDGRRRARRRPGRRRRTGSCPSTPPGRATGPAAAVSSSSTTRSRRSRRSRGPTTSAGSSWTATTASTAVAPDPRRRVATRRGSATPILTRGRSARRLAIYPVEAGS